MEETIITVIIAFAAISLIPIILQIVLLFKFFRLCERIAYIDANLAYLRDEVTDGIAKEIEVIKNCEHTN